MVERVPLKILKIFRGATFPESAPWGPPNGGQSSISRAPPTSARRRSLTSKVEIMTDADALSQMREVAARYVRLAQRLEEASDGADSA
jgi:hypothetical protein